MHILHVINLLKEFIENPRKTTAQEIKFRLGTAKSEDKPAKNILLLSQLRIQNLLYALMTLILINSGKGDKIENLLILND